MNRFKKAPIYLQQSPPHQTVRCFRRQHLMCLASLLGSTGGKGATSAAYMNDPLLEDVPERGGGAPGCSLPLTPGGRIITASRR